MRVSIIVLLIILFNSCNSQPSGHLESVSPADVTDHIKADDSSANDNSVIYFSFNNGENWENKSNGLPREIWLTDIAVSDGLLGISTKQNGIFFYESKDNTWRRSVSNPPTSNSLHALTVFNGRLFVGTENEGIFTSDVQGKSWISYSKGLQDLT